MIKVYIASKCKYADKWKKLFSERADMLIISRWPYYEGSGIDANHTYDGAKVWIQDITDVQNCDLLILYAKLEDDLKGALIEAGAALGLNKHVALIGDNSSFGTWVNHPNVFRAESIDKAISHYKYLKSGW